MAEILAGGASPLASRSERWRQQLGARFAQRIPVTSPKLIGVRHLRSEGRRIPVLLFRNGRGSVAAHCLIQPGDTPILDGPSAEEVLAVLAGVIDDLLLARGPRAVAPT
jgi:hypothetical protein